LDPEEIPGVYVKTGYHPVSAHMTVQMIPETPALFSPHCTGREPAGGVAYAV